MKRQGLCSMTGYRTRWNSSSIDWINLKGEPLNFHSFMTLYDDQITFPAEWSHPSTDHTSILIWFLQLMGIHFSRSKKTFHFFLHSNTKENLRNFRGALFDIPIRFLFSLFIDSNLHSLVLLLLTLHPSLLYFFYHY